MKEQLGVEGMANHLVTGLDWSRLVYRIDKPSSLFNKKLCVCYCVHKNRPEDAETDSNTSRQLETKQVLEKQQ